VIQSPLVKTAGAVTGNSDGLSYPNGVVMGNTIKLTALSLHDFNLFRKLVAEAINTLDKKIEDILKVTAPSC